MTTVKNGFSSRQPKSLGGLIEFPKDQKVAHKADVYSCLLKLDSSSLQILKAVAENDGIGSKGLEDKVKLSRAPVLSRSKNLDEEKLLLRTVRPGTENHSKPTFVYSLPSSVTLVAINCAIAKLTLDEYLKLEGSGGVPEIADQNQDSKASFPAFDTVQEMLEVAFQKIANLESRLSQVEEVLQQPDTVDREKLLNILKQSKD